MKNLKFYRLKRLPEIARTQMGLIGRPRVRRSGALNRLFRDNYTRMEEADLLKAWFPGVKRRDPKRVVVLTAHDDDLLAFAGTLAKLAGENRCQIHHLVLTDGSMGCGQDALEAVAGRKDLARLIRRLVRLKDKARDPGYFVRGDSEAIGEYVAILREAGRRTADIRQREARDAEKILGFHSTYFLGFPDAALGRYNFGWSYEQNPGVMALALRLVRDIAPDLLVLQDRHQKVDFNPDHYAAGQIGYAIYWHLRSPVLGVDPLQKPFRAIVHRGFEGIFRAEFRFCDYLVRLSDVWLERKFLALKAYKNQIDLLKGLFDVGEMEKFRIEGFFDVDLPSARLD